MAGGEAWPLVGEARSVTFRPEALEPRQLEVLHLLGPSLTERGFHLVGGTAVALVFGHRRSVDLDWFTGEWMGDALVLARALREEGIELTVETVARGTLHGSVDRVRVSLLEYPYPLLAPLAPLGESGALRASLDDLSSMKLSAIAQRGARKDFVDLYALLERHRPLPDLIDRYRAKYETSDVGHLLSALAYFDDAEREPMPRMLWPVGWRTIRSTIRAAVRQAASL